MLARKWTIRARGRQVVFVKKPNESERHVLMKIGLWALHADAFPELVVEGRIGDRYAPDVVALDGSGEPVLWCEAGTVAPRKITSIARRFRQARLVIAKWGTGGLDAHRAVVERALKGVRRDACVELWGMPTAASRYVDDRGDVVLTGADVERVGLIAPGR